MSDNCDTVPGDITRTRHEVELHQSFPDLGAVTCGHEALVTRLQLVCCQGGFAGLGHPIHLNEGG